MRKSTRQLTPFYAWGHTHFNGQNPVSDDTQKSDGTDRYIFFGGGNFYNY